MVGITSWGSYIPKYRIKVQNIADAWGENADKIISSLQVEEKSVPGIDEDTATIAVEAARNALKIIDPKHIGALYIGSESHPYAVKPTGTIVAEAIGVSNQYMTADFQFACKAGTAAIQVAMALVKAEMSRYVLAGGCDTAQSKPGDALEYTAAAGGAVFIIGREDVVAEIVDTVSYTSDTPDFWRRSHQEYPAHAGAFTGEPAYYNHVIKSTRLLLRKTNTKPQDFSYVIFHQPNGKFPLKVANQLGFSMKQVLPGLLVSKIGNTYSSASLLGLAAVLDIAKPNEKILLTSYGSGAGSDSFYFIVTDQIIKMQKLIPKVSGYIKNKVYIDYPKYLRYTRRLQ